MNKLEQYIFSSSKVTVHVCTIESFTEYVLTLNDLSSYRMIVPTSMPTFYEHSSTS